MSILKIFLASLVLSICLIACVEPFETNFELKNKIYIVEGKVSNLENEQFILLKESYPSGPVSSLFRNISGAKVSVIENNTKEINYVETSPGVYQPATDFVGIAGNNYKLSITLPSGSKLESTEEVLKPVAPIKKIYSKIDAEAYALSTLKTLPGHVIYIDYDEPAGKGDNYYWTWNLYEKQNVCATCQGGIYQRIPAPAGSCQTSRALSEANVTYDYTCESECWEIYHSTKLIAANDKFSDGKSVVAKQIAEIPFYNERGGLIEILQQSVSNKALNYLQLLIEQGQNTGTLADTPPAALIGNMVNLDQPEEVVGGYFMATSIAKSTYWIDRTNISTLGFKPYGMLNGRTFSPEPSGADITRPPLAPCLNLRNRTTKKPEGFQF